VGGLHGGDDVFELIDIEVFGKKNLSMLDARAGAPWPVKSSDAR
jgi:hypothetical protein